MSDTTATRELVKNYYGKVLETKDDLKTSACCTVEAAPAHLLPLFAELPDIVLTKYYGCGFPVPPALSGARVLDLGCGTGRDVFLAALLAGKDGRVVGVDMTDEQLAVAHQQRGPFLEKHGLPESAVEFKKGHIEDLAAIGLEDNSFDCVISNCVVNLSGDKPAVIAEVHRVLAEGGEFYFSDVFTDRRLPEDVATDEILYGECLGGALYEHDFVVMARDAGFRDARIVSSREIEIHDPRIKAMVGAARFFSITYRLFKIKTLDDRCEDYGQSVIYKGGIEGSESLFWFDDHHCFEKGRSERVCGNTFDMLKGRFGRWFDFTGDRSTHFGRYPDCDTMTMAYRTADGGSTTASGGCC